MPYHIRFTPYDISGYTFDWLDKYEKYLVFREVRDKKGQTVPEHFHIYIEDKHDIQTIRLDIKSKFKIPKSGRGEGNRYYAAMVWDTPDYICKWNDEVCSKGFTEKEVMECVISGKKKYLDKVESPAELRGVEISPAARKPREPKVPYQQQIIALAAAEWYNYKKTRHTMEQLDSDAQQNLVKFVCEAMRKTSRGINQYLVSDICRAVLFDDLDWRDRVINKLISKMDL